MMILQVFIEGFDCYEEVSELTVEQIRVAFHLSQPQKAHGFEKVTLQRFLRVSNLDANRTGATRKLLK